jgi:hypothetical protein
MVKTKKQLNLLDFGFIGGDMYLPEEGLTFWREKIESKPVLISSMNKSTKKSEDEPQELKIEGCSHKPRSGL